MANYMYVLWVLTLVTVMSESNGTSSTGQLSESHGKATKEEERTKRAAAAGAAAAAFSAALVKSGTELVDKAAKKLFSELFDRNRKDEIDKALKEYAEKFLSASEKESAEYQKNLDLVLERLRTKQDQSVKEGAEISFIPGKGMDLGDMFAPPSWKIKETYRSASPEPVGDRVTPYRYKDGVGNALLNGCFGNKPLTKTDPCYQALQPLANCQAMLDAANFIGVGFDGRGDYSASSRKKSVIQRTCFRNRAYGHRSVPDTMTVHGVYDTNTKTMAFESAQKYQSYLERKAAVAQSNYMFQEATVKAYGRASGGFFGLFGAGGGGGGFTKKSSSTRGSQSGAASGLHNESGAAGIYLSLLELSVIRYELFLDDISYDDLNLEFLQDFLALPQSFVGSDTQKFQDFILRWGTHYVKSAKFGGQLKVAKTKRAAEGETIDAFAARAQADYQAMFSTYSSRSAQFKSSSWFHSVSGGRDSKGSQTSGKQSATSASSQDFNSKAFRQRYSNEAVMVEGGDQNIAAAISEMYSVGFKSELVDWLRSIPNFPKPYDFQMAPITDLCEMNYISLFPNGSADMGCFGNRRLLRDPSTGRKYYVIREDDPAENETTGSVYRRYCDYDSEELFRDSLRRRCNALRRAVSVYLEEGPIPSTDIYLPPGGAACDISKVAIDDPDWGTNVVPWSNITSGSHFKVIFDSPVDIPGVADRQEVLVVFFHSATSKWFVRSKDGIIHLYDGYKNGGSYNLQKHKISIRGLVLDYNTRSGFFTVTSDNFFESRKVLPHLPKLLEGATIAKAEFLSSLHEIREHKDKYGIGAVPCNVAWSNAHRFDRYSESGACVLFTAVTEGDLFVVFSVIPRDRQTWYYLQIGPQGVAIYKGSRVMKFISDPGARSLGDPRLFESYFACIHENPQGTRLTIKYGKTADNGEEAHVFALYEDDDPLHVRFYAFGNGKAEATIVDVRMFQSAVTGMQICLGGTVMEDGRCVERCHPECVGCHSPNADTACRLCRNVKLEERCVPQCPVTHRRQRNSNTCVCRLKESGQCVSECSNSRIAVHLTPEDVTAHCMCRFFQIGLEGCLPGCPPSTTPVDIQGQRGRKSCRTNVRLVGGTTPWNGRVEVLVDGSWGTVCDDKWHDVDAQVVCRQLGHCGGVAKGRAHFGEGAGRINIKDVQCTGREENVLSCEHEEGPGNCVHYEDAGVVCKPCDVRLAGGNSSQGRVEVKVDDTWGTICNQGWDDNDANVVCRQLGYCNGTTVTGFGRGKGPVFYGNMRCQGREMSIKSCPKGSNPGCKHSRDVGVSCNIESPCLRLVDGTTPRNGRVEAHINGRWGTVCDNNWDDNDARVVCRQLGLCGGLAAVGHYYGAARDVIPVHLNNVRCRGSEASLFQCPMAGVGKNACRHDRDAGVACSRC